MVTASDGEVRLTEKIERRHLAEGLLVTILAVVLGFIYHDVRDLEKSQVDARLEIEKELNASNVQLREAINATEKHQIEFNARIQERVDALTPQVQKHR